MISMMKQDELNRVYGDLSYLLQPYWVPFPVTSMDKRCIPWGELCFFEDHWL